MKKLSLLLIPLTFIVLLFLLEISSNSNSKYESTYDISKKLINYSSKTQAETPTTTIPAKEVPDPEPVISPPISIPQGITVSEVSTHNSSTSCWTIVSDSVYDLTTYIKSHPGGQSAIKMLCGKDGTTLFLNQHNGDSRPNNVLNKYYLDRLSN